MKGNKKKLSKVLLSSTLLLTMFFTTMPTSVFATEKAATPKAGEIAINETNFPDANFRKYIKDTPIVIAGGTKINIDANGDGSLSQDEIINTKVINLNVDVNSLKGIEYFTALENLACDDSSLKSLDLSQNSALKTISCNNNQNLTS
ncbi:MAG: hypothetical protein RSC93_14290, partial [Erysipelotrichaceae bacterium]